MNKKKTSKSKSNNTNLFNLDNIRILPPVLIKINPPISFSFTVIFLPLLMGTIAGISLFCGAEQKSSGALQFWLILQTIFMAVAIIGLFFGIAEKYFGLGECVMLGMTLFLALLSLCLVRSLRKELLLLTFQNTEQNVNL